MSQYGFKFASDYDPNKTIIYNMFTNIYDGLSLTKIKNENKMSTYMAKVPCMLMDQYRYIIVNTDEDINKCGSLINLTELHWVNFQTRTLKKNIECNTFNAINRFTKPIKLAIQKRTEEYTHYTSSELIINVYMLHIKKNNLYEYPNSCDLFAALDNYNTIISF